MVTVIIPIYNKGKYLSCCLDSIIQQSYKEYEVILVDDGSTDNTREISQEYCKKDKRFRLIYQENGGQNSARLRGVRDASYDKIMFIDADDWIDSNYFSFLVNTYENEPVDLVTSGLMMEYPDKSLKLLDGIESGTYTGNGCIKTIIKRFIYDDVTDSQGIVHSLSGKLLKKDIMEKVLEVIDTRVTICEDGLAVFNYLGYISSVTITNYIGYHYIQLNDSTIHTAGLESLEGIRRLEKEYIKSARKQNVYYEVMPQILKLINNNYQIVSGRGYGFKYVSEFKLPNFLYDSVEVIIYGAGKKGMQFKNKLKKYDWIKCKGWVDKRFDSFSPDMGIISPIEIKKLQFDYILIAIEDPYIIHEVVQELLNQEIDYSKIWTLEKNYTYISYDNEL